MHGFLLSRLLEKKSGKGGKMYRPSIRLELIIFGIALLVSSIVLSILLAFPTVRNINSSLTFVFAAIAFLTFFGTIFMMFSVIFPQKEGGIPILVPKDYADEDGKAFHFCPIKRENEFWLSTAYNFYGETVAVSQSDFAPKDRKFIQESLENSMKQEKRLKLMVYGCRVGKGYIFVLIDPEDQEKPSDKEGDSSKRVENSGD